MKLKTQVKAGDSADVKGPWVNTNTTATQLYRPRSKS